MSSNTKYQPTPQRDSFEEGNYSQAPPSYQEEASQNDGLLGAAREEDDNLPDDFKVGLNPFRRWINEDRYLQLYSSVAP